KDDPLGLGRLLTGALFLAFALSLVPGMFGSKLGDLDAYVPLAAESARTGGGESALVWMKNDYRGALDQARQENKLVLVNFTGYACTNCHWMKANMFPRPEIAAAMKDYVLLELYTDERDEALAEANQKIQDSKFKTISVPYYAILDPDEKVIGSTAFTSDPKEYLGFLKKGQAVKAAS